MIAWLGMPNNTQISAPIRQMISPNIKYGWDLHKSIAIGAVRLVRLSNDNDIFDLLWKTKWSTKFVLSAYSIIEQALPLVLSSSITFLFNDVVEDKKKTRKRKSFLEQRERIFFDRNRSNNTCDDWKTGKIRIDLQKFLGPRLRLFSKKILFFNVDVRCQVKNDVSKLKESTSINHSEFSAILTWQQFLTCFIVVNIEQLVLHFR